MNEHALELEKLRVTRKGELSKRNHRESWGSALTNPNISTDFAEAQIELITPVFKKEKDIREYLNDISVFMKEGMDNELLWPFSMPAILPKNDEEIILAQYGTSYKGLDKTKYRNELGKRYGRRMQTISGIHYNFSFEKSFWDMEYKKRKDKSQSIRDFIDESYFNIIRNFIRYNWLNIYLFGATPAADKSFFYQNPRKLKKLGKDTFYGEYATSLRMSEFGYHNEVHEGMRIPFNSLKNFLENLEYAISTVSPKYKKFSPNDKIIQNENEFYAPIRPKQPEKEGERVIEALRNRGLKYIEVRAVDTNPYETSGIDMEYLQFLHVLMNYCFYKSSPKISKIECGEITKNRLNTSLYGRKKNLKLIKNSKKIKLKDWGEEILKEMMEFAISMDKKAKANKYSETIKKQLAKMSDQSLTLSAKILEDIKKHKSFVKLGLELANKHKNFFKKQNIPEKKREEFIYTAKESIEKKKKLEFQAEYYLRGYEELEVSTQILIRAALKRGIKVEVLDKKDSFISLEKNGKKEYVKQATKTSLDSYITFLIMENKYVSKKVLEERGIKVPAGEIYYSEEEAISDYPRFSKNKVVVKPNSTNFGIGVAVVNQGDKEFFLQKIKDAFTFDKEVIVEEFIDGPEYRFLVIGDKVEGIVHRVPANVIGDGVNNIKKLIELKNDQKNIYYIKFGATEKNELKKQSLTLNSIPKKGEQIFLRTNSNVSTGGDALDFTDDIPKKYKKIAVEAAKAANAKICGVDMIINKKNYGIIEINFNPALEMHAFPFKGKKRDLANPVLDLLGFASK